MTPTIQLYNFLVNRIPSIQRRYYHIRREHPGTVGRIYGWLVLVVMNISWALGFRNFAHAERNPDYKKRIPLIGIESSRFPKVSPKEVAIQMSAADIISADVFDTLIFRPLSDPADLFYLVEDKLNYLDFARIRRETENMVRQEAKEIRGTYEVTFSEIYDVIEQRTGIPKAIGMQAELETELECCYGNPYMLEVFEQLRQLPKKQTGRRIICTSDMYLPKTVIRQILDKCGFDFINEVYISCECRAAKGDGALYHKIMEHYGREKAYFHIGDNREADIRQAGRCGWQTFYYPNINMVGRKYRAMDMSVLTGSFYRGIVNAGVYGYGRAYSKDFEVGYIYGGLFVLGYCQFIHRYITEHNPEKLIFLARDGDILYKIYQQLYPTDCKKDRAVYGYWSRTVATKLAAGYFKEDYFRRFLHHKVNQNLTLRQIFQDMELDDMLSSMLEDLKSDIPQISEGTVLTQGNEGKVWQWLNRHWEQVLAQYKEESEAGRLYYRELLSGCNSAVTIDIGWAGSGSIVLQHMVNQVWNLDCEITGLLAGTNTLNNTDCNSSESALYSGRLVSYLYSQEHNRDIWKWHNPGQNHNLLMEGLVTSTEGSLKGFRLSKDTPEGYLLSFKKPDSRACVVQDIQSGIQTFIDDYRRYVPERYVGHAISGSDCYAVLRILLQSKMDTSLDMGI